MTTIKLYCRGSFAAAKTDGQITAGTVGLPVELHWDSAWDGMAKTLFFRNSLYPDGEQSIVLDMGEPVTVPGTVLAQSGQLYISAEGISRDGKRVLHTQWADCGKIRASGRLAERTETELSLEQQLRLLAEQAMALAQEAKELAGNGGGSVELDATLTLAGKAADAKATGDALENAFTIQPQGTVKLLTEEDARKQQYDIDNLKAAADGQLYRVYTDTQAGYRKTVPQEALPWCTLDGFGGKTVIQDGQLVHGCVSEILSLSEAGAEIGRYTIPEAVRNLPGYGWSANTVRNEVDLDRRVYIQRVAAVDLSTLEWKRSAGMFYAEYVLGKAAGNNTECAIYSRYTSATIAGTFSSNAADMTHGSNRSTSAIYIKDSSCDTIGKLQIKLDGVLLLYELATPIETDISDLLDWDGRMAVEGGGTLEFVQEGGTENPVSGAVSYLVKTSGGV